VRRTSMRRVQRQQHQRRGDRLLHRDAEIRHVYGSCDAACVERICVDKIRVRIVSLFVVNKSISSARRQPQSAIHVIHVVPPLICVSMGVATAVQSSAIRAYVSGQHLNSGGTMFGNRATEKTVIVMPPRSPLEWRSPCHNGSIDEKFGHGSVAFRCRMLCLILTVEPS